MIKNLIQSIQMWNLATDGKDIIYYDFDSASIKARNWGGMNMRDFYDSKLNYSMEQCVREPKFLLFKLLSTFKPSYTNFTQNSIVMTSKTFLCFILTQDSCTCSIFNFLEIFIFNRKPLEKLSFLTFSISA